VHQDLREAKLRLAAKADALSLQQSSLTLQQQTHQPGDAETYLQDECILSKRYRVLSFSGSGLQAAADVSVVLPLALMTLL
jgi:hypothetical protein